jgi:hypothetical protein
VLPFFLLVTQHAKAFSFSTGVNLVIKCTMQIDRKMTLQIENDNELRGTLSNTNKHNTKSQIFRFFASLWIQTMTV